MTAASPIAQRVGCSCAAYLLRASLVNDLSVVLSLVAILPCEVDSKLARLLVVAGVDGLDLILPGSYGRLPSAAGRWWSR